MLSTADEPGRRRTIDGTHEDEPSRALSSTCAPLEVATSVDASGAPLIVVCGEVDLSNVVVLESAIDSAIADSPERIVIDMSEVSLLSSVGLRALLRASERVESLRVRAPSRAALRVLEISGLVGTALAIEC